MKVTTILNLCCLILISVSFLFSSAHTIKSSKKSSSLILQRSERQAGKCFRKGELCWLNPNKCCKGLTCVGTCMKLQCSKQGALCGGQVLKCCNGLKCHNNLCVKRIPKCGARNTKCGVKWRPKCCSSLKCIKQKCKPTPSPTCLKSGKTCGLFTKSCCGDLRCWNSKCQKKCDVVGEYCYSKFSHNCCPGLRCKQQFCASKLVCSPIGERCNERDLPCCNLNVCKDFVCVHGPLSLTCSGEGMGCGTQGGRCCDDLVCRQSTCVSCGTSGDSCGQFDRPCCKGHRCVNGECTY